MIELVFIRHGLSEANKGGLVSGWSNTPLSKEGIAELEGFRDNVAYPKTQLYYCSDLPRCLQTFDILFSGTTALNGTRPEFREIDFGKYESVEIYSLSKIGFFERWTNDEVIDDLEQFSQFVQRISNATQKLYNEMKQKEQNSCTVICHSGVIRAVYYLVKNIEPQYFWGFAVPNGRGVRVKFNAEQGNDDIFDTATLEVV